MPAWLLVIALVLATFRVTRLIVKDDFPPVRVPREWVTSHAPTWVGELIGCHWCASGWVAMALVAGTDLATSVPVPVLLWLAAWAGGAWIAHYERENPDVLGVSARVLHEFPSPPRPPDPEELLDASPDPEDVYESLLVFMRNHWGTLGLVSRALGDLRGEKLNTVLAAVIEQRGRRTSARPESGG